MSKLIPLETVRFDGNVDAHGLHQASGITWSGRVEIHLDPRSRMIRYKRSRLDGPPMVSWIPLERVDSIDSKALDELSEVK